MTTLFISDLHLAPEHPDITENFFKFLAKLESEAKTVGIDALYILGDLFEAWIGDDIQHPYYLKIIDTLKSITNKSIPLYIMHGNRDFLLGETFAKNTGCKIIEEPYLFSLYGEKTLLMHGDVLCLEDTQYLAFRKMARDKNFQQQFLNKSFQERIAIAQELRQKSGEHQKAVMENILDATPSEVMRVMQMHQVQLFIHGHTHRPSIHHLLIDETNEKPITHIVLSDWGVQGNVLYCYPNGEKRLVYF